MLRQIDETWAEPKREIAVPRRVELTVVKTSRMPSELERFRVEVERRGHVTIVLPHGELDLATVETLRTALDAAVAGTLRAAPDGMEIRARLVLDLRGLSFFDSTGLHLLAALDRRAKREGFELGLLAPAAPVNRAIQLSGLDQVLPFVAPDDAADGVPRAATA